MAGLSRGWVIALVVGALAVTGVAATTCTLSKRTSAPVSNESPRTDEPTTSAPPPAPSPAPSPAPTPAPEPVPAEPPLEQAPSGGAPPTDAPGSEAPAAGSPPVDASPPVMAPPPPVIVTPPPPPPTTAPAPEPPFEAAPPPPADRESSIDTPPVDRPRSLSRAPVTAPATDKPYDVVPVFFGTDRGRMADPNRVQYGSERGRKLELGRAMVTVPMAHKVPNIERPWVVEVPYFRVKIYEEKEDPAKHFTMQELKTLSKDEMIKLVRERLAKSKDFKDHALVFVHGFNTSFDAAIYRTAQVAYDLKFDGVPFLYTWPSGGKVASYTYDRGSAEQAEPFLAEFLDIVVKQTGAKSISLIAHSMGNELLLRVLERMRTQTPNGVVISQVILAAPDVDRDKFGNIAREIASFAKGVTLYAASNDRALSYSARFWGGVPRAGDVPVSGPLIVPGVDTIDVTSMSTDSLGLNHSGYAENSALLADIQKLVRLGERPPERRSNQFQKITNGNGTFWRYVTAP